MRHFATSSFWANYNSLPERIQQQADGQYTLLKANPGHPSLQLKKIGSYWSVRISRGYRALALDVEQGLLWFWIGSHADYDKVIR
jgi:hypothetical protein